MNCPSCQSKAKELGPDHIVCSTCGDISRVGDEWVLTETLAEDPKPGEDPKPAKKSSKNDDSGKPGSDLPTSVEDPDRDGDEHWLSKLTLCSGGGE